MYREQRPLDIANQIKLEMDSRNPRLRLTVLTTLSDNGVEADKLLTHSKELVDWVGSDLEELLSEFLSNTVEDEAEEVVDDQPLPSTGRDSGYL